MRRARREMTVLAGAACVLLGCTSGPVAPAPTGQPAATASASATLVGTAPAPSTLDTPAASPLTSSATGSPVPSATASLASPTGHPASPIAGDEREPPLALLGTADAPKVAGRLGSWCYENRCADVIPGPPSRQPVLELATAGGELELALPPPHRFVYWRVQYRDAGDDSAAPVVLAEGGSRYPDPDEVATAPLSPLQEFAAVAFGGPPSGEWLIEVRLEFTDRAGNAPYYWYATVP